MVEREALLALAERAVIALERIAGALSGAPDIRVPDETLVADLNSGMSLRQVAAKHGVGVGRVRGACGRARAAQGNPQ